MNQELKFRIGIKKEELLAGRQQQQVPTERNLE
jgi:hypothetical protein